MPVAGSTANYAVGQAILLRVCLCRHSSFGILNPNAFAMHPTGKVTYERDKQPWSKLELRAASLGLGVLAGSLTFGVALAVSEDLRLLYATGAILLFCGATWLGVKSGRDWLSALLFFVPLAGIFCFFVLRQLPFLWPNLLSHSPFLIALAYNPVMARRKKKSTPMATNASGARARNFVTPSRL
jgi:hypothetical protein